MRPSDEESTSAYGAHYAPYREAERESPLSAAWWSARFYARIVRRYAPGGRLLELACGVGNFLSLLEDDFECWGIDISAYALERARLRARRSHLLRANVASLAYLKDDSFDVVIAKHVLEHLQEGAQTLRESARVLREGGLLLMAVPSAENPLRHLKGDQWIGVRDKTHVAVLGRQEWLALLEGAGLRTKRVFSDGFWDVPYLPYLPKALQLPVFALPAAVQALLGRPLVPAGWGESLIVLATKDHGAPLAPSETQAV